MKNCIKSQNSRKCIQIAIADVCIIESKNHYLKKAMHLNIKRSFSFSLVTSFPLPPLPSDCSHWFST